MDAKSHVTKKKPRKALKIILWILLFFIVLAGSAFLYGYYHYSEIIRKYLVETIEKESRGLYKASIEDIHLNVLSGNITVKKLALTPDTAVYRKLALTDTISPMLFGLKIDLFKIKNFDLFDAYKNKAIKISQIQITAAELVAMKMGDRVKDSTKTKSKKKLPFIKLPKGLTMIMLDKLAFENGKVDFYDYSGDSVVHKNIPSINITMKNFLVDKDSDTSHRIFNAEDISISLQGIELKPKNGMNVISLGEIAVSTGDRTISIKKFHLKPQFNRYDYTRKLGFQTDRIDVQFENLLLQRVDFYELLSSGAFMAGKVTLENMILDDYRDKRIAAKPGFKPPMPQEAMRNLKTYVKIDTLEVKNSKATYTEQVGGQAGTIFFNRINGTLFGLTNDSAMLASGHTTVLKASARMFGKGKVDATFWFKFGDKNNAFRFTAEIRDMDLREVNPMLSKLAPAEVKSGRLDKLVVPMIYANNDNSNGKLLFYYSNLAVEVKLKQETKWDKFKGKVANTVANDLVLNDANPNKNGKMYEGTIYFERDKSKGIINFLWKSMFSGVKSTIGINSKQQKELIDAEEERNKASDSENPDPNKPEKKKKFLGIF